MNQKEHSRNQQNRGLYRESNIDCSYMRTKGYEDKLCSRAFAVDERRYL